MNLIKIKKFLKRKKWVYLALLIVLIVIGLLIYFLVWLPQVEISEEELSEEDKSDKISPSTAIVFPKNKSWHNSDFEVTIYDSDIGSGLISFLPRKKGCRYIIEDLGTRNAIGNYRKCDPVKILVPVGEGKTCSSSYQKEDLSSGKCKVSTKAFDRAGNDSGWKSRLFNIDLIPPKVEKVVLNQNLEIGKDYLFKVLVSDNSKITGCWLLINGEVVPAEIEIEPIPCENDNECIVSAHYSFDSEGDYFVKFSCSDLAGNYSFGNTQMVKVTTNHPPEISSCRVTPTQGTAETEFQFEVQAIDPDEDELFYLWDFGDGENSSEKNPAHSYLSPNTYEPQIVVSDEQGEKAECLTAWVIIIEN